jgi:hypothetical protein
MTFNFWELSIDHQGKTDSQTTSHLIHPHKVLKEGHLLAVDHVSDLGKFGTIKKPAKQLLNALYDPTSKTFPEVWEEIF